MIPDKVFNPSFEVQTEDEQIVVFSGRDNCAPVKFFHDGNRIYLEDVKEIHLVIDGKEYINSIHNFFSVNTKTGTAFFVVEKHYCDLFPKGKNRAKIIFFTESHPNGVVWSENFIIDIR